MQLFEGALLEGPFPNGDGELGRFSRTSFPDPGSSVFNKNGGVYTEEEKCLKCSRIQGQARVVWLTNSQGITTPPPVNRLVEEVNQQLILRLKNAKFGVW